MNPCLATLLKVEPAAQVPLVIVTGGDFNQIRRGGMQTRWATLTRTGTSRG